MESYLDPSSKCPARPRRAGPDWRYRLRRAHASFDDGPYLGTKGRKMRSRTNRRHMLSRSPAIAGVASLLLAGANSAARLGEDRNRAPGKSLSECPTNARGLSPTGDSRAARLLLLSICVATIGLASCSSGTSCDASALFSGLEVDFSNVTNQSTSPYQVSICLDEDCTATQFADADGHKASVVKTLLDSSTPHRISFRLVDSQSKVLADAHGSYTAELESDSTGPCQKQAYVIRLAASRSTFSSP